MRDGESGFIFESDEQRRDDTKDVPTDGEAAKASKKLQQDDETGVSTACGLLINKKSIQSDVQVACLQAITSRGRPYRTAQNRPEPHRTVQNRTEPWRTTV